MTRDIDLLGYGDDSVERVATVMRALCNVSVPDDGLSFDSTSVRGEPIRGLDEYGGVRIALAASLGSAAIRLQVDVGFGDAVTPGPQALEFPVLLDLPKPQLRAYPPETVIAEKLLTLCERGLANSRMKDYFDLLHLAQTRSFDSALLIRALRATAERRRVILPPFEPTGLTLEFGHDAAKRAQWAAFLRRTRVVPDWADLERVVEALHAFLGPVVSAARDGTSFDARWSPGGPWS